MLKLEGPLSLLTRTRA